MKMKTEVGDSWHLYCSGQSRAEQSCCAFKPLWTAERSRAASPGIRTALERAEPSSIQTALERAELSRGEERIKMEGRAEQRIKYLRQI